MSYNIKNNRGAIADPMSFRDTANVEANSIATLMTQKAAELGVPVNISVDTVKGLIWNVISLCSYKAS